MATFKNNKLYQVDVPVLDLHVGPGETFEIPDEVASSFEADADFAPSKAKNPDVSADPSIVAALSNPATGPVGVVPPESAAIAPDAPNDVPSN